jgi:hypothetical protein
MKLLFTLAKRAVGANTIKSHHLNYMLVSATKNALTNVYVFQFRTPSGDILSIKAQLTMHGKQVWYVNHMMAGKLPPFLLPWLECTLSQELQKYIAEVLLEEPAYG